MHRSRWQLDFVVDCRETPDFDGYGWAPTLRITDTESPKGQRRIWLAGDAFTQTETVKPMTRVEQFVHALLMSNEFVTID